MERIHGIVLRQIKYSDTRQIIDLFTLEKGRMSLVQKIQKNKSSFLSHLDIIEFDIDSRPKTTLPLMHNIEKSYPLISLRFDTIKTVLVMFLSEFLSNALREESENANLFKYIEYSLCWLDKAEDSYANFHIVLLIHITRFLGIEPNTDDYSPHKYFDLQNGCYSQSTPTKKDITLSSEESRTLPYLLHMNYENMHLYHLSRRQRRRCLEVITTYYQIHIPSFRELNSVSVLKELFD